MNTHHQVIAAEEIAEQIARFAVEALLEEVRLTPKPGLVDRDHHGTHHDLNLELMERSAYALQPAFYEMVMATVYKQPSQAVREQLAAIGRYGEQQMLQATGQVNTHKGAIWALGLLAGAAGILTTENSNISISATNILLNAGAIAAFTDRYMPVQQTNGLQVRKRYTVRSAREEAVACFPSLQQVALPAWNRYRDEPEQVRRLNVLLSLMAVVDDTCILHRSDMEVLRGVQQRAQEIMVRGGLGNRTALQAYLALDAYVTQHWVSPGGSADLLAATIFLEKIIQHFKN